MSNLMVRRQGGTVLQPQWLTKWRAEEQATVTRETVVAALAEARANVEPCSLKSLAQSLDRLLAMYRTPDDWADKSELYLAALDDVPEDLLPMMIIETVKRKKFFPVASEIREPIERELNNRHATVRRLEAMLNVAKWPEPDRGPVTDAEKDKAKREVEAAIRAMTEKPAREMV